MNYQPQQSVQLIAPCRSRYRTTAIGETTRAAGTIRPPAPATHATKSDDGWRPPRKRDAELLSMTGGSLRAVNPRKTKRKTRKTGRTSDGARVAFVGRSGSGPRMKESPHHSLGAHFLLHTSAALKLPDPTQSPASVESVKRTAGWRKQNANRSQQRIPQAPRNAGLPRAAEAPKPIRVACPTHAHANALSA